MNKNDSDKDIDKIKLIDRIELVGEEFNLEINTENPIEQLTFIKQRVRNRKNKTKSFFKPDYKFWLLLFICTSLGISFFFNKTFLKTFDPYVVRIVSNTSCYGGNLLDSIQEFTIGLIYKPYVLTVGEYGNFAIAKERAIKLLPYFKQIDIKKLKSGTYVFEIQRFSSKKKAYRIANKLSRNGLDEVHVRYLQDQ